MSTKPRRQVLRGSRPLTWMAILATLAACYVAGSILVPIVGAVFLALLFRPAIRRMERWRIPPAASSTAIILVLTFIVGIGLISLGQTVVVWIGRFPETAYRIEEKLDQFRRPLADLNAATTKIEEITDLDGEKEPSAGDSGNGSLEAAQATGETSGGGNVVAEEPAAPMVRSLIGRVFSSSLSLAVGLVVCLSLTLLLMMEGRKLEARLVSGAETFEKKRRVAICFHQMESLLTHYLVARTAINVVYGVVVWAAFRILDLPQAGLWAVTAAILNYVPYIGPLAVILLVLAVSVVEYDSLGQAILPPLVYFLINVVEGMIVAPIVIGRWLKLNPVSVFLGVIVGGWFWGIAGGLMAMPILLCIYVICANHPRWEVVARMIADDQIRMRSTIYENDRSPPASAPGREDVAAAGPEDLSPPGPPGSREPRKAA